MANDGMGLAQGRSWWHIALGILLAVMSWAVWQARFQVVPHLINGPVTFQGSERKWQFGGNVSVNEQGELLLKRDQGAPTALLNLGKLDDARFVQISVESRWNGIPKQEPLWASARIVLTPTDEQGRTLFGWDHGLFGGFGSSDWKRHEAVFELRPEWKEVRFSADIYAVAGDMAVRRMEIHVVRQRAWVPAATVLLLLVWTSWLTAWLHRGTSWFSWLRTIACSVAILSAWWFAVWPQMKMMAKPLGTAYWIGTAAPVVPPPPPKAEPPPATVTPVVPAEPTPTPEPKPEPPPVASTQQTTPAPAKPAPAPPPPPEKREAPKVTDWFRGLDQKFSTLHFLGFFCFALGTFVAAGGLFPWRWVCLIALASEVIPDWTSEWQFLDWEDAGDLFANYTGILAAAILWLIIRSVALHIKWLRWLVVTKPKTEASA